MASSSGHLPTDEEIARTLAFPSKIPDLSGEYFWNEFTTYPFWTRGSSLLPGRRPLHRATTGKTLAAFVVRAEEISPATQGFSTSASRRARPAAAPGKMARQGRTRPGPTHRKQAGHAAALRSTAAPFTERASKQTPHKFMFGTWFLLIVSRGPTRSHAQR